MVLNIVTNDTISVVLYHKLSTVINVDIVNLCTTSYGHIPYDGSNEDALDISDLVSDSIEDCRVAWIRATIRGLDKSSAVNLLCGNMLIKVEFKLNENTISLIESIPNKDKELIQFIARLKENRLCSVK